MRPRTRQPAVNTQAPCRLPISVAPMVPSTRWVAKCLLICLPSMVTPQATIEKMRVVRAAAMAPAEPSGQDSAVAAQAMQALLPAQSELASGQTSAGPQDKPSEGDSEDASAKSRESASEEPSRTGQKAKAAYQNIADFGAGATSNEVGFLPITA